MYDIDFKPNYDSHYKMHANKSIDWLRMDTKELYEKNLKENYNLLKKNNWIDKSFTYKFNSHGFRCEEFTTDPTIMFLGCSFTCGIGLPIENIWPEIVSNKLNMRCANLGQGAGSNDTAFRLCHGWIDNIKPKIVVLLNPPGIRLEMIDACFMRHLSPSHVNSTYHVFLKDWARDDNNSYFNSLKNTLAIENLCRARDIKFIILETNAFIRNDFARDLAHFGVLSNSKFAEYVISRL